MIISGHQILVEKGKWVEDRLYHPAFYGDVVARIVHLVANPDYPSYRQFAPLNLIRRIRIGDNRVYAKVYPAAKIVTILAVVARGSIKKDERGGALDFDFATYLQTHNESFLADRFEPMRDLSAPEAPPQEPASQEACWTYEIEAAPLTEDKAMELLNACRPTRGPGADYKLDPYCEEVVTKISSRLGERVLVDLPAGAENWEKKKIVTLQASINKAVIFFGLNYSVRFDDLSRKFLLVPKDKIDVYCYAQRGRKPVVDRAEKDVSGVNL